MTTPPERGLPRRRGGWPTRQAWERTARVLRGRSERGVLVGLLILCGLDGYFAVRLGPDAIPSSGVQVLVLLGAILLRQREERLLIVAATATLVSVALELGTGVVRPPGFVVFAVIALISDRIATTRDRVGVPGLRGESILAELRDRLAQQGEFPSLLAGWNAEVVLRPAGGASFGGDFVVSDLEPDSLELALVDVSGKGVGAATRALLLSGALGGLMGSVSPEAFLGCANDYLLRQDWVEGFATAAHATVDLRTGDFTVDAAGHPPVALFSAGSGSWTLLDTPGPAIGFVPDPSFTRAGGTLARGDALLLYTDGVVEAPGRDLAVGIDKLLGEATRLVVTGFRDGATRLMDAVPPTAGDDRAVVLIWREL